jgi:acetyl-CoA carboxylase biotin carboxyl carrier protein
MKNQDEIREILEMMRQHELTEFELERDDLKIRIKKGGTVTPVPVIATTQPAVPQATLPASNASQQSEPAAAETDEPGQLEGIELAVVKSPIVGTFYRASEPGAPNFVEVGDTVRKGQVLCIIEAMKLMNEIESEYDGEIANIYVDNGLPVQYGERLFAIKVK